MIFSFLINPFKSLLNDKSIPFDVLFFSFLLILLPIVLTSGPALPDIFLSLIALFFLIKSVLKKEWSYYKNPIFYGFLVFSFYGIFRSIFSEMPLESLTVGGSIFYFRYIFFSLGVWYLLDKNHHLSKCILNILVICILFVCFDALYQYFNDFNIFGNKKHSNNRLTGVFRDEPIVGRYVSYLSLFAFVLIYQNFSNQKNIMIITTIFLCICEVVIFLSGERAPFFNLMLFTILIVIFISNYRIYKLIGTFFSIFLIMSIIFINPNAKIRMIDLTINQVSKTQIAFLPYSDHHEEHYVSALKMFNDSPFFGVGTNLFRFQCNKPKYIYKNRSCNTHPHNFYLQLLAELGLVGLSLFNYLFFIYIIL
jgi:O-antigen ligase